MAGAAQLYGRSNQNRLAIGAYLMATATVIIGKRRMKRISDQFRLIADVRIVALQTIGSGNIVSIVSRRQGIIDIVTGDTKVRRARDDEADIIRSVGGVAGVTLTLRYRGVSVLSAEFFFQIIMTGVTQVGGDAAEFRKLPDHQTANIDFRHSARHKLRLVAAVRIVTAGAISLQGRRVYEFLLEIKSFVIVTR